MGSLLSIQSLDLSFNGLSGEIPASLQHCSSLRLLDISFNNFTGPLPQAGVFNSLAPQWIEGNHLCGSLPGIPSCHRKNRRSIHSHKALVLLVSIAVISAFLITVMCATGYMDVRKLMSRREDGDSAGRLSPNLASNFPRITYKELAEATAGFETSRLIGSGSFGHVYKGVLGDGSLVAIKVLQLQSGNSTRSFKRECQVLKNIRHRNLMRIITACSLPDFKALVLPFMANGSLESHLYPETEKPDSPQLSLLERVNICSDIAEGLAYLHHHSPVKVIHCDLKPSNILLNDDMTAQVSDFGIARLVMTVPLPIAFKRWYVSKSKSSRCNLSFVVLLLSSNRVRIRREHVDEGRCLQLWDSDAGDGHREEAYRRHVRQRGRSELAAVGEEALPQSTRGRHRLGSNEGSVRPEAGGEEHVEGGDHGAAGVGPRLLPREPGRAPDHARRRRRLRQAETVPWRRHDCDVHVVPWDNSVVQNRDLLLQHHSG
ncbi:hypothetical protein BHE74_00050598 [Ensete ventricosum]|nr:hypothetical protein BHE74_00050598 [Ensete ventricosum]